MHKLLSIQLRKHLGLHAGRDAEARSVDAGALDAARLSLGWAGFLEAIDQAYRQFDRDLALCHRSLSLSTEELQALYLLQRRESLQRLEILEALRRTARSLLDESAGGAPEVEASDAKTLADLMGRLVREREEAQSALAAREAHHRNVLESVKEVIFQLDPEGRWIYLNGAWTDLTGFSVQESLGRSFLEFVVPEQQDVLARDFRHLLEGHSSRAPREARCIHSQGEAKWVKVHVHSTHHEKSPSVYGTIADITEQKRSEAALLQAQKLESLGVLAGGIAHDFNNLMVAIMGNADLAARYLEQPEKARKHLDQVQVAIGRAAELCHQLLAYSGKGRFNVEVLDLNALVTEMAHLLNVSISKSVSLDYHLAPSLPPIEADPSQIRQALMNLVINASEAIGDRPGSILIETGTGPMETNPHFTSYLSHDLPEGPSVFLRVRDDGCGMDEKTLKRIFDPFFTTKFTGRGLGLAAILGIVRSHKGGMEVDSRPGRGTTFCLHFPASTKPLTQHREEPATPLRGEGLILLVDDEPTVRSLMAEALEVMGFTVLQAPNGQKGLDQFEQHRDSILAVFLDLTMPVMGGEAAFKAIQKLKPGTPTILMSGYSEQETHTLMGLDGMAGFLQKPFKLRELSSLLQKVLAKGRPQAPAAT